MITFRYSTGEYGWLHNFSPHKCRMGDVVFPSSEAAYQWSKIDSGKVDYEKYNKLLFEYLQITHPKQSKLFIKNEIHLWRKDWDDIKDQVMFIVLENKLKTNPELKQKLKDTGNEPIAEISTFDRVWGLIIDKEGNLTGDGENRLGKCWMALREII